MWTEMKLRAELTIKDNNDVIVANQVFDKENMGMYCYFINFLFNNL